MVGVDLLQNGDLKNAVVSVISGLTVSAFFFMQNQAILGEETTEKFTELYAKLDELEKRD